MKDVQAESIREFNIKKESKTKLIAFSSTYLELRDAADSCQEMGKQVEYDCLLAIFNNDYFWF